MISRSAMPSAGGNQSIISAWLSGDSSKSRLETTHMLPSQTLSVNSLDVLGHYLVCGTDGEAIFVHRQIPVWKCIFSGYYQQVNFDQLDLVQLFCLYGCTVFVIKTFDKNKKIKFTNIRIISNPKRFACSNCFVTITAYDCPAGGALQAGWCPSYELFLGVLVLFSWSF